MKFKKQICLLLCLLFSTTLLFSCKEASPQATSYYEFFDTVSVIFSYRGDSKEEYNANCDAVYELFEEYHKLFDIYYEYSGINNLKTVNKNAGIAPVKVDEKLIDFLMYSKEIHHLTNGKTNIAMGSVVKLWKDALEYGTANPKNAYIPSDEALQEASKHTDINNLIIDKESGTVFISDPDMCLDVGAIAKGYATERAAELLIKRGATSYVLNIGGNIRAIGKKSKNKGWTTGITNPDKSSDESFVCRVVISDTSLVTSGDYERYYIVDSKRYHHIIDPATNMPAEYFSSVSIFTKDSALADSLSTALFCMSYEEGLALINTIQNVDVIWVYPDGTVKMTENIKLAPND